MKCLIWRQHRWQLFWSVALIAATGAVMIAVGRTANRWLAGYHSWLVQLRAAGCPLPSEIAKSGSHHTVSAACRTLTKRYGEGPQPAFANAYNFAIVAFEEGLPLLLVIIGVLVGAPLVAREIEQRTQLVAWTQSVSRRGWYLAKVAVLGAALTTLGLLAGVANDHLQIPLTNGGLTSSHWPWFFSIDVAPAAETLLAFALGVALGAWLGRTLAAVGAALVAFLVLFLATGWAIRTLTPVQHTTGALGTPESGWLLSGSQYHPASQYWPLQATYAVLLLALAVAIMFGGWRAVRKRAV